MSKSVADKLGKGISPQQFMDGMEKNKDKFLDWYNQFSWKSEDDQQFFESFRNRDDIRCLIIAAEWCGDVVRNVPVVFRALENSGISVEVFIIEQHTDFIDQYLTMGGRAIPIVIFADSSGYVLGKWGPRPEEVQAVMNEFKRQNPDREAADYQEKIQVARQEMARLYGEGTDYHDVILKELREILSTF